MHDACDEMRLSSALVRQRTLCGGQDGRGRLGFPGLMCRTEGFAKEFEGRRSSFCRSIIRDRHTCWLEPEWWEVNST
jgi:hypothetical protein